MRRTTLVADNLGLKFVRMLTIYDTWVVPISVTVGNTLSGKLMFEVDRYLL